jgi:hypothetical protein
MQEDKDGEQAKTKQPQDGYLDHIETIPPLLLLVPGYFRVQINGMGKRVICWRVTQWGRHALAFQ